MIKDEKLGTLKLLWKWLEFPRFLFFSSLFSLFLLFFPLFLSSPLPFSHFFLLFFSSILQFSSERDLDVDISKGVTKSTGSSSRLTQVFIHSFTYSLFNLLGDLFPIRPILLFLRLCPFEKGTK